VQHSTGPRTPTHAVEDKSAAAADADTQLRVEAGKIGRGGVVAARQLSVAVVVAVAAVV
jgi:hypothetical protein